MVLYDFLAPFYDPVFEAIYRPFRTRALEMLPATPGASVLDLACGTGQNFPLLAERMGEEGRIVGIDISSGMLRRARQRVARLSLPNSVLIRADAARFSTNDFQKKAGLAPVDFVVCSYGFTSMPEWKGAFRASWELLKPGGGYLILDVDGAKRDYHVRAVEMATRSDFSQKVWEPLQAEAIHFQMDYLDPSAHLFGGRLFVAYGERPPATTRSSPCLS